MDRKITVAVVTIIAVLTFMIGFGCKRSNGTSAARSQRSAATTMPAGLIVEPGVDEALQLDFEITRVSLSRKLTEQSPWYSSGGDWTILECQTRETPPVNFSVGVRSKGDSHGPFGWGEAALIPQSRETGDAFSRQFAAHFHGKMPKARSPQALAPVTFGTAVLGSDGSKLDTKWFPSFEGAEAEVFFNYDINAKRGEFSEKDPDYRDDLVKVFAGVLRDGPRPFRTPETDPNLTRVGPSITQIQPLPNYSRGELGFAPDGHQVIYSVRSAQGEKLFSVPADHLDHTKILTDVEKRIDAYALTSDGNHVLVREGLPQTAGVWSSDDSSRLWWIDDSGSEPVKQELKGPWVSNELDTTESAISPGGLIIAVGEWSKMSPNTKRVHLIHFCEVRSGKWTTSRLATDQLFHTGWIGENDTLRAVLRVGIPTEGQTPKLIKADPSSGNLEQLKSGEHPLDRDETVSPDARHRFLIKDGVLSVYDVASAAARTFHFHDDDLAYVDTPGVTWASPRYLLFVARRPSFIDVQTLKMNYPLGGTKSKSRLIVSPDFGWVLLEDDNGARVGRITATGNP